MYVKGFKILYHNKNGEALASRFALMFSIIPCIILFALDILTISNHLNTYAKEWPSMNNKYTKFK